MAAIIPIGPNNNPLQIIIKKTMIKYNLTTWALVLALERPFQNTELESELSETLEEFEIFEQVAWL